MVGRSGFDSAELVAGRPRLPVKSRLKTAPTARKQPTQSYKVSFSIWPAGRMAGGWAEHWHL